MMAGMRQWVSSRSNEFWRQVVAVLLAWLAGLRALDSWLSGSAWMIIAGGLLTLVTLAGLRFTWSDERKRSPLLVAAPMDLVAQNVKWLSEQGTIVIVTRDMSWTLDAKLQDAVRTKASNEDLVLIAAKISPWLQELKELGAQVVLTRTLPNVRFTVLRYGTSDARVLVHRQVRGLVEFREFTPQEFPTFSLCLDIVNSHLERVQRLP